MSASVRSSKSTTRGWVVAVNNGRGEYGLSNYDGGSRDIGHSYCPVFESKKDAVAKAKMENQKYSMKRVVKYAEVRIL
jgi:hypothetical protein